MSRLLLACCAFATTGAAATTITIECPSKFPVDAIRFGGTPQGWTAFAPGALEVGTAELMYGAPSTYSYAAPTTYRQGKRTDVGTWAASTGGQNWLQCGYGAAKELTLSRQLPSGVTDCTITKYKDARGNVERVVATCTMATPAR